MAIINAKDEIVSYHELENGQSHLAYLTEGEYKIYIRGDSPQDVSNITFIA